MKGRLIACAVFLGVNLLNYAADAVAQDGGITGVTMDELGDTTITPPLTTVLDRPALQVHSDAEGRMVLGLPAITLIGPPKAAAVPPGSPPVAAPPGAPGAPAPAPAPGGATLPRTGMNVHDYIGAGLALLAAGMALLAGADALASARRRSVDPSLQ